MRFQIKMLHLHPDNPLRSLTSSLKTRQHTPRSARLLLAPLLTQCPLLQNYLPISNASPPWDPYTIPQHINANKLQYFLSVSHLMPRNILSAARDNSLVDISLRIRNPHIRSLTIRWRTNRLLASYRCRCGTIHNRGHISTCWNLQSHPLFRKICHTHPFPNPPPTNHYNLIDHALNHGRIRSFLKLLHFVTASPDFIFDPP